MSRTTFTGTHVLAGCFVCRGSDAIWTSPNAMAVAARHHDATGHQTWADQVLSVRYGADVAGGGGEQLGLFDGEEVSGG